MFLGIFLPVYRFDLVCSAYLNHKYVIYLTLFNVVSSFVSLLIQFLIEIGAKIDIA